MIEFDSLVGQTVLFYGVDNNRFQIGIHGYGGKRFEKIVFEAIPDENDGMRSYLDSIEVRPDVEDVFFRRYIAKVTIIHSKDAYRATYCFVENGHCWLEFGTNNVDDYYPMFVFDYQPKRP